MEAATLQCRHGAYYNDERPHRTLDLKTPAEVYLGVSWLEAGWTGGPQVLFNELPEADYRATLLR